jgi:hypothetical protein
LNIYRKHRIVRCLSIGALSCAAIAWALALASSSMAQENEPLQPPEVAEPPVPPAPPAVPNGKQWKETQVQRNAKALLKGPQGGPTPAPDRPAELEALQAKLRELQQAHEELARHHQKIVKTMQHWPPSMGGMGMGGMRGVQRGSLTPEQMEQQKQFDATQAEEAAAVAMRQQHIGMAPLPPDAVIKVFSLNHLKPEEAGQVVHKIFGGGGPRIAIDERTNALLIAGDDKQTSVAEALIQKLDQPSKAQQSKAPETLQVRVVWLLDGLNDRDQTPPKASVVGPQVIDALGELGFENPQVVCQQLTTFTIGRPDRSGHFQFQVPVLIEGSPWQFEGEGTIGSMHEERYAMEFNLSIQQPNNSQNSQLSGSILTPLDHYTVLGTTTFVGGASSPGDPTEAAQSEHLSAFVVHLQRAKEFSDSEAKSKGKAEKTPSGVK